MTVESYIDNAVKESKWLNEPTRKGESGGLTVYLRNERKNDWDILNIIVEDNTLQIDVNKQTIRSGEVATLTLSWGVPKNYPDKPYKADFRVEGEFIIKD